MAIKYVSNEATNGYIVGNDSTGTGNSPSSPYLTIAKAIAVVANTGDTIYVNGTTHTVNSITWSKACNLQPSTDYGVTIKTTNATRCLNLAHALGGTNTVGKFIIDCDNVAQVGIQLTTGAVKYTLVVDGTRFINLKNYGIACLTGNMPIDLTVQGGATMTSSNAGFTGGVTITTLTQGNITVNNLSVTSTAGDVSVMCGVDIAATATGCTFTSSDVTQNWTLSTTAATRTWYGYRILNIDSATIIRPNLTASTTKTQHRLEGTLISTSAASPKTAYNARITGPGTYALTSAATGHGIIIGEETPDGVHDNLTDGGIVDGITIVGSTLAAAANYHGIIFGNNRNGEIKNCNVSNVGIGIITKYSSGHKVHDNVTSLCHDQHYRSKAATCYYYKNKGTGDATMTGIFLSNTEDENAPSFLSHSTWEDNIFYGGSSVIVAVSMTGGSTGKFSGNIYNGANLTFNIQGVTYTKAQFPSTKTEVRDENYPAHITGTNRKGAATLSPKGY